MIQPHTQLNLPKGEDLPSSDGLPVDNELHILIPNLLASILGFIWAERLDWFLGINMGIFYATGVNPRVPIVPDAFLCLGVERVKDNKLRESYVVWEENNIAPLLVLEVVSKTSGDEYDKKMAKYAQLGALYYVIYNPDFWQRDKHEPFEVYRLDNGQYQRSLSEPFWMPEIGLGIGRGLGNYRGIQREWLYWYNQQGQRIVSPEELLQRYQERFGELS
ncbi:Uma2 family endonuclease [Gloeothece verrucosa]|uniref:Putative restriction endonuclease domain-containing protein n=1 Tax=Gloeothece verrucosa (strain PCC 7822) TaxID=497965 RepID=E0U8Y5_GLOV7|nr:Uma2 family endonuclease [Gloeothece verrucosa]ADN16124.1 protein of unknown function DUF820 [Gloeothece verrucosa PCC 7822]